MMSSQLASQLQRLQQRPEESSHRLAKSFLFSTQDARSFSREQIHQLALNGLQTLTAMDNRFHPFIQDLFDVKRVRQERAMLTSSEDAALRASLEHFLTLLSPHLFLTAAQQVFEFLVRVYEVHIYDVSAVLRAFLPYHDHNIFARALLLLDLRDTGFDFLSTNQLRGAPLLREHLILACAESRKAARLVCLTVAMSFRYEIRHHAANALFASVVTQLSTHKNGEALWRTFLPFVLELLSGAVIGAEAGTEESKRAQQLHGSNALRGSSLVTQESVATALVVLAAWAGQVRFSSPMLNTVLKPIFRYLTAAMFAATNVTGSNGEAFLPVRDLLAFLEIIFATQYRTLTDVSLLPLLQSLLALPWRALATQLPFAESTEVLMLSSTGMPSTSPRHSVLLATLLQTALDRLTRAAEVRLLPLDVVEFLSCAAEDLPLSNAMVTSYLRVLMTAEAGAAAESVVSDASSSSLYHRVIAALERRYPVVFDEVLSEVLLHADTVAAASAFLARHFQGTRYNKVEVGSVLPGTTESLPLFACLLHPVAEVRVLAAKTLQGMTVAQLMAGSSISNTASPKAQTNNHYLVGLLAHVASYEHVTSAAVAFVAAGATIVQQLTVQWLQEDGIPASCRAACELVRAFYKMVLSLMGRHADHSSARAEALQCVVRPLLTSLLRPAVTEWTTPNSSNTATRHFRACVLYHVTLLYMQRSSYDRPASLNEVLDAGVSLTERSFGDVNCLAPLLKAISALGGEHEKAKGKDGKAQKGHHTAAAASDSDSDNEEEKANSSSPSSISLSLFKAVMQSEDLLREMRAEAQEHLCEVFAAARTAVREPSGSSSANTAELLVALAAILLPVKDAASALQVVSTITSFLCGTSSSANASAGKGEDGQLQQQQQEGYLNMVYAALLELNSSRHGPQTGRGAMDVSAVARWELYKKPLVKGIALVLRTALLQTLVSSDATSTTSATLTLQLCKLLTYTGAPLPAVTVHPEVLATAYLDLIAAAPVAAAAVTSEEVGDNGNQGITAMVHHVDWHASVSRTVFEAIENDAEYNVESTAKTTASTVSSLAALALVLFLPLRAQSAMRLKQLRVLQDAVVSAGAERGPTSCAHSVVAAAMRQLQNGVSATTLSCIIECIAMEERQYQLTLGAAEVLCELLTLRRTSAQPGDEDALAYVVPAGWAHRVIRYFFVANSNSAERGRGKPAIPSSSFSGAWVTPQQMCLTQKLLVRVEGILTRSDKREQNLSHVSAAARMSARTVTADVADLVDAVCSRLRLWSETEASAEGVKANASVRMIEALLRHPYLHVRNGGGARPVYRHALTALTVGLSAGLEDRRQSHSTIFTTSNAKKTTSAQKESNALSSDYQKLVAMQLRSTVLHAMDVIGTDVAVACMLTIGGYEYFFLPLISAAEESIGKPADESAAAAIKSTAARREKKASQKESITAAPEQDTEREDASLLLQRVREMLEVLAPDETALANEETSAHAANGAEADGESCGSNVRWRAPAGTIVANPLTYMDAVQVLRLPQICAAVATGKWGVDAVSQQSLALLRMLLQVLPTVIVDDEEEQESVYYLVEQCLELYPLQEMEGLLRQAATAATADDVALMPRVQQVRLGARGSVQVEAVLRYVEALVRVCTEQTRLLSENVVDGAYRIKSRLLREMMLLMASVLADGEVDVDDNDAKKSRADAVSKSMKAYAAAADVEDAAERRKKELHFHVDTIASLLRTTAPLLKLPSAAAAKSAAAGDGQDSVTYLHVPLVSLLIKLESIDNTEALDFRSAREVCQDILTSLDIRTQVQCVTQLMRLVTDPAAQLAPAATAAATEEGQERSEVERVQHLFRRMVKPNQVINRQEAIMHLVNLTVKSDLFLEPFLTLQRRARSSQPRRVNTGSKKKKDGKAEEPEQSGDEDNDDNDAGDKTEGLVLHEDGGCMELLVSALELFAHYHDLHTDTSVADSAPAAGEEAEAEAYTALLELLAGNTLACVLAGINEPTFVVCQQRLLEDKRAALRKIGLEVLLDRLHHSLPTLENVVSDEEMEAHRRRLRDPRVRLSLVDLVRIKARPLTTKRSTVLFPLLVREVKANFASFYASLRSTMASAQPAGATNANADQQLLETSQLGIACVEELIRIVSSGGSLQSERTLLNANRSKRVTEAALVKLFGNRGRVMEVHEFVETVCDHWMPLLTRCEVRLRNRGGQQQQQQKQGGADNSTSTSALFCAAAEEGILGCMTCLVTALATITQVMGTAFASSHSLALLHTLVSAGMYQVVEMPGLVARSRAGALLRHSTLSSLIRCFPACWQMTQPYLPSLLFMATHLTNATDAESHYLCAEMLAVLEALMEPQLLLDAGTSCLQGIPYANGAVVPASEQHQLANITKAAASFAEGKDSGKKPSAFRSRQVRVQVQTHSFSLLFTCVERRIENLSKEELMHMSPLMEGTRPQQNFWLAAFNSLASAPTVPSSEAVMPVLQAFTVFLLKFKAKHGARLLRMVADWAFAETSSGVAGAARKHTDSDDDAGERDGRGHDGEAQSLSRLTLQSWIVFFALTNHLLSKLGSIFDFAFPTILPHVVTTLRTYCAATATVSKATDSLVALALEGALECVRGMALSQTPGPDHDYSIQLDVYLANADVFPGVMPALVHQLHNLQYLEDSLHDYRFRVEHNVIPAIRAFMACLGSSKLQSKTQAEIVRALRHPSRHVRREALLCLDGIYADGGEELASRLMAEMLPAVVELTEDRDDAVVEEARKLCNNLSHMTGQDVLYAMS